VRGLIATIGGSLGGALGWWLGKLEGVMTAFFLSILGTAAGVYLVRRLMEEYLP
jgi:membrane protein YqaA with SNARE-associated domain